MTKVEKTDAVCIDAELLQLQKEIIDVRLEIIADSPERIRPIAELTEELDK
jgi:hypothetical protein